MTTRATKAAPAKAARAAQPAAPIEPPADKALAVEQPAADEATQPQTDPTPPADAKPQEAPKPAAAPLAAPIEPPNTAPAAQLMAPIPPVPPGVDEFLGYVDDQGNPIDPDDLFDLSGIGTVVTAKVRANAAVRRGGSKTVLMSLAFPLGEEVSRSTAAAAIAEARAAVERQAAQADKSAGDADS